MDAKESSGAIKIRLSEFLKHKQIKFAEMERMSGLSNGYLRNSNGVIGATKLRDILNVCPDLNVNWLLTGNGPMLIEDGRFINQNLHLSGDPNLVSKVEDRLKAVEEYCEGIRSDSFTEEEIESAPVWLKSILGRITEFESRIVELQEENRALREEKDREKAQREKAEQETIMQMRELIDLYRERTVLTQQLTESSTAKITANEKVML